MNDFLHKKSKGFVILIATLLSGLFLILSSFIFSISLKELILSSGGRESQFAFYAADSGIECALYWDLKHDVFATSTHSGSSPSNIFCGNQDITANPSWVWKNPPTTDFKAETLFGFDMFPDNPTRLDCVRVVVHKENGNTWIESRGYNTCDINNLRRVERGLRVAY